MISAIALVLFVRDKYTISTLSGSKVKSISKLICSGINSNGETYQPKGYVLVFHPDLIHGTALGRHIQEYTFFNYQSNEALHLSERERKIVLDCFAKIEYELEHAIDTHSKRLIVSNIELFLNYCVRFYDRQFITRE